MFSALKWALKQGLVGVVWMILWMIPGLMIMSLFCWVLGAKNAFYVPRLFESWSGLSPLLVGFIFGGWAGAFIVSVCIAGWSRDFNSLKDPAIALQGVIGMVMGEALAIFLVLRSADQAMAMGVAVGFAAALGCALDIWIRSVASSRWRIRP